MSLHSLWNMLVKHLKFLTAISAFLPHVSAIRWFERAAFQASSFAGETVGAVFPVPNATNAASEFDSFFPAPSVVGFAGPTPSMSPTLFTTCL